MRHDSNNKFDGYSCMMNELIFLKVFGAGNKDDALHRLHFGVDQETVTRYSLYSDQEYISI